MKKSQTKVCLPLALLLSGGALSSVEASTKTVKFKITIEYGYKTFIKEYYKKSNENNTVGDLVTPQVQSIINNRFYGPTIIENEAYEINYKNQELKNKTLASFKGNKYINLGTIRVAIIANAEVEIAVPEEVEITELQEEVQQITNDTEIVTKKEEKIKYLYRQPPTSLKNFFSPRLFKERLKNSSRQSKISDAKSTDEPALPKKLSVGPGTFIAAGVCHLVFKLFGLYSRKK